jgi:hypothetical protein
MSALFEISYNGVTRKETGSKLGLNLIFLDIEHDVCYYENSIYDLKFNFCSIVLTERFALKQRRFDRIIQQPVSSGIILEKDNLRAILERSSVPTPSVNVIITDIYELMEALFLNGVASVYQLSKSGLTFRVYEAEKRKFNDIIGTIRANKKMDHETIEALQAELVFEGSV